MRRLFLSLMIVLSGAALCLAQQPAIPSKSASAITPKAAETKTMKGKVESVSLADPQKGTKSEITVSDEGGQKYTILVKSTTTIYDVDWKAVSLDKISKDAQVKVKYSTTKEGVNEALSINIQK